MAAAYNKYNQAVNDILAGNCNFGSDTLKLVLNGTTVPLATVHYYSSFLNELATSDGYTAGGASLASPSISGTSGTASVNGTPANPTWTSTTGTWASFEWISLYDSTPASNKTMIGWWDYGSGLVLNGANGDTFTVTFSTSNVPFTMS